MKSDSIAISQRLAPLGSIVHRSPARAPRWAPWFLVARWACGCWGVAHGGPLGRPNGTRVERAIVSGADLGPDAAAMRRPEADVFGEVHVSRSWTN